MRSRGYALVFALILVAAAGFAVMVAVTSHQVEAQREREAQLLFVGDQYRRALASYASVGSSRQYPEKLEQLLEDKRFPNTVRHLRQLYADPITGRPDWEFDLQQGRIVGVHSRGKGAPLRHANFPSRYGAFANAHTYADWDFTATSTSSAVQAGAPAGAQPGAVAAAPVPTIAPAPTVMPTPTVAPADDDE